VDCYSYIWGRRAANVHLFLRKCCKDNIRGAKIIPWFKLIRYNIVRIILVGRGALNFYCLILSKNFKFFRSTPIANIDVIRFLEILYSVVHTGCHDFFWCNVKMNGNIIIYSTDYKIMVQFFQI